jgi:hypothetical protein
MTRRLVPLAHGRRLALVAPWQPYRAREELGKSVADASACGKARLQRVLAALLPETRASAIDATRGYEPWKPALEKNCSGRTQKTPR